MLRIYIGFQVIKFHCFPSSSFLLFIPPPPPPHFYSFPSSSFYCFPSSSSILLFSRLLLLLILLFSLLLLISIVFPPPTPPPPPPPRPSPPPHYIVFFAHSFNFFFYIRFYKRLPTAILSSFWSNVSCSEQESWFSSAVSWLPCLSAPVSFKDSYSTATTFTSPSLIQYNWNTFPFPKKISGYCCHIRTLYLTWPDRMSLTKQRSESLYKRVVVLLKMY